MAKANPFRFSTKYQDEETDLVYYGYRFYSGSTGRWVSRDPVGTRGGANLYGFVANTATDRFDRLGLDYLPYPFSHSTDTSVYQQPQRGKKCGVCGPEVGTALLKTFESVERKFATLQDASERKTACSKLGLLGKWDITFQQPPAGCASGDCKNTVAINGKCYSAWAVNYLLFGRISKLCSFSEATMQSMVFGNKAIIKPIWQTVSSEAYEWQYTEDVRTFAHLGFEMDMASSLPPSSLGYGDCKRCTGRCPQKALPTDWP